MLYSSYKNPMQYKLPKRRFLPILLTGEFVAAIFSFYIVSRLFPIVAPFFPYAMTFLVGASLYTIGRFLVFDTLYCLSDEYTDFTFKIYRIHQTTSTPIATLAFTGEEALFLFNKSGRKRLKKKKKLGVYTANLIPKDAYALTCTMDDKEGYILLELDPLAKEAIAACIARAKRVYTLDDPQ